MRLHYSLGAFLITCSWIEFGMESLFFLDSCIRGMQESYSAIQMTVCVSSWYFTVVFMYLYYFHLASFQLFDPLNCLMKGLTLKPMLLRWTLPTFFHLVLQPVGDNRTWGFDFTPVLLLSSNKILPAAVPVCACWISRQEVNLLLNLG